MVSYAGHSSSSFNQYHVFLSFRGEDIRKSFVGHLYKALCDVGVLTFRDNEELNTGEGIGPALITAIEHSRISIPIFSEHYASSKWCLKELAKILQCHKSETNKQLVLPIFFDVEPSDVRHQNGSFADAFLEHQDKVNPVTIDEWRNALTEVGKLKGWDLKEIENGDESKLIQLVVDRVLKELNNIPMEVAKHPTAIDSLVKDLLSFLSLETMDSRYVGICGMGGIGKTTIAIATFNRIYKWFDGSSFLMNVREEASKGDLVSLQKQFLIDVSRKQNYDLSNVSNKQKGVELIKERLQGKRVLLVLDDVDHNNQLNALAGDLSWFGRGSRIIVTTRNEHILKECRIKDNEIYQPYLFDGRRSLQLFSMHAFWKDQPKNNFLELSLKVVNYSGGLPLVLVVLGNYLCDKSIKAWKDTLKKLEKLPHDEVHGKLKISYDGLEESEKSIFLDTACFFIGMDVELAIYIWKGCDFHPVVGLQVLGQKSLVTRSKANKLQMHDQLREVGRRIVFEENSKDPGKRSRLWLYKDIMEVIDEQKRTGEVEGNTCKEKNLVVEGIVPVSGWEIDHLRIQDLMTFYKLRLLQVDGVNLEGNFANLPPNLSWFSWQRCPSKIEFCLEKLVVLNLSNSNIEAWTSGQQNMQFKHLKVLDLSNCSNLAKTPDFSGFPKLKRLILKRCTGLVDIESIGQLKRLAHLNLNLHGSIKLIEQLSFRMLDSLVELVLSDECVWIHNAEMNYEKS